MLLKQLTAIFSFCPYENEFTTGDLGVLRSINLLKLKLQVKIGPIPAIQPFINFPGHWTTLGN